MKISPLVHFSKTELQKPNKTNNQQTFIKKENANIFASQPYFGNLIIHRNKPTEFKPSKISSITPHYEPFCCNYDNLDEFCEKYTRKLNSQLLPATREDILLLINKIKNQTGAQEDLIKEVLFQLTSFTQYSSLKTLQPYFKKAHISHFGISNPENKASTYNFSSNENLNYLAKKSFLNLPEYGKKGIVLDDLTLTQLEELKKSNDTEKRKQFEKIIDSINEGNLTFFNIKGWDIKCSDNKYRSANMFYGTNFLESLAIDIIKKYKKCRNLDDILYSDLEKRLTNIFKHEKIEKKLDIVRISNDKDHKKTPFDILNNINKKPFSEELIKEKITALINSNKRANPKELQIALLKYLNEFSIVFSNNSLTSSLISLKRKITSELKKQGCNENEIQYVITAPQKSFGLITNMYVKLNEINPENVCTINDSAKLANSKYKARIILDDMTISGVSQCVACNNLKKALEKHNIKSNIYYATVLSTKEAQDYSEFYPEFGAISLKTAKSLPREIDVHLYSYSFDMDEKIENFAKNNLKHITKEELKIILETLDLGFLNSGLVCEFPHMLPDNNSQIANSLFANHLHS